MNTLEHILSRRKLKPFVISDLEVHSMGPSIFKYIEIKMHHLLRGEESLKFNEIIVVGQYDRDCIVSKYEKDGKLENWQRPTVEILDDVLVLKCFPGKEYVRHYASLVASYFSLRGEKNDHIFYIDPTDEECWNAVYALPLDMVEKSDAVVIGAGLFDFTGDETLWQASEFEKIVCANEILPNGRSVSYLMIQFSFWGDILYRIVHCLASLGHKKIIFTAKLGGIDPNISPNETLATGNLSCINGQIQEWDNLFDQVSSTKLVKGYHISSPSVLFETKDWVEFFNNFTFVDPEVGYFAKAASEAKIKCGYLHFVSNNLSVSHEEDLSNEREKDILEKRQNLQAEIVKLVKEVV